MLLTWKEALAEYGPYGSLRKRIAAGEPFKLFGISAGVYDIIVGNVHHIIEKREKQDMNKRIAMFAAIVASNGLLAAVPAEVTVSPTNALGQIKIVNATNSGPTSGRTSRRGGCFEEYRALEIPYARIHDTRYYDYYGGPHCADISGMFPDFEKDENDPANYDFTCADDYMKTVVDAGAEPFFQLGETIEHWIKKFLVNPPKDFAKWARICEHVIMHYNEGWADGYHMNVKYWEIWNEPDAHRESYCGASNMWGKGTPEQFYDFYETAAKHLKARFPDLKIGGPALSFDFGWADKFLAEMRRREVPMDFFSWHCYCGDPAQFADWAKRVRDLVGKHGYGGVESIMNEWNYVRDFNDLLGYSRRAISGDLREKGAAFVAASMIVQQHTDISLGMYYDAQPWRWNGMFDSNIPVASYYAFQSWALLRRLGTEIGTAVKDEKPDSREISAIAAKDGNGRLGVLVVRFCQDDNAAETRLVTVRLESGTFAGAKSYFTDRLRAFTAADVRPEPDGTVVLKMTPNSFVFIETGV